jgi:hypothetical protein
MFHPADFLLQPGITDVQYLCRAYAYPRAHEHIREPMLIVENPQCSYGSGSTIAANAVKHTPLSVFFVQKRGIGKCGSSMSGWKRMIILSIRSRITYNSLQTLCYSLCYEIGKQSQNDLIAQGMLAFHAGSRPRLKLTTPGA